MDQAWLSYASGVVLMSVAGTIYLFPVYSDRLHDELGFTQSQTNFIGSAANAGTWFGVLMGLFFDTFGVRPTLALASAMCFLGYFVIYLATSGVIDVGYIALSAAAFLFGQGSGGFYACALNTNVSNWSPRHRGKVVGGLVAFFGLCAGIQTQVYKVFLDEDVASFLLYLSLVVPGVGLLELFTLRPLPVLGEADPDKRRLVLANGMSIVLIVLVALCSILQVEDYDSEPVAVIVFVGLASYWLLPCIPGSGSESTGDDLGAKTPLLDAGDGDDAAHTRSPYAISDRDLTVMESVKTPEFWLLFVAFCMSIGTGVTVLDNVDKLIESHGSDPGDGDDDPHKTLKTTAVALFSVFNTSGRVLAGLASDAYSHKVSRPAFLTFFLVLMAVANVAAALCGNDTIYLAVSLLGLAYGGTFCMAPTLTSEMFGAANFGAVFGAMGLAPAVGGEVFSTGVASTLYEAHETDGECYDDYACFGYAFAVNAVCCLLGALCAAALWRRTSSAKRILSVNSYTSSVATV